jgi:hypothetical protein
VRAPPSAHRPGAGRAAGQRLEPARSGADAVQTGGAGRFLHGVEQRDDVVTRPAGADRGHECVPLGVGEAAVVQRFPESRIKVKVGAQGGDPGHRHGTLLDDDVADPKVRAQVDSGCGVTLTRIVDMVFLVAPGGPWWIPPSPR